MADNDNLRNLILNAAERSAAARQTSDATDERVATSGPSKKTGTTKKKPAKKKPARKKAAKKKPAKKAASKKTQPDTSDVAPTEHEQPKLRRWREFATLYIFGRDPDVQPYNASQAYRAVYGEDRAHAKSSSINLLDNPRFQPVLREVAREKSEKLEVDSSFVANRWITMADADVTDYVDDEGEVTMAHIRALPKEIRQNLRKLEINEHTTGSGKDKVRHRQIKIEIVDRKAVLDSIAKWQSMFADNDMGDWGAKLVEMIRQGAARAQRHTVTLDGETGKVVE